MSRRYPAEPADLTDRADRSDLYNPEALGPLRAAPAGLNFTWKRVGLLAALGALTIFLLLALSGGQQGLGALAHANWPVVALAVAIHYSSFAVRGLRWQTLLALVGHRLGYLYTTALLLAGWFVSALLPGRVGDLVRIGVLRLDTARHAPVPVADSLSSIVLERALDILAILVLGASFGFVLLRDRLPGWLLASYAVGVAVLAVFGLALLLVPPLVGRLRRMARRRLWQATLDFVERFVVDLRALFAQPRVAAVVSLESLYIWLCDALVVWLVLVSLDVPISFGAAAFVALTVDVIAAIPLTPGGIGQIDAAYASLLALLAQSTATVGLAVLIVRLITYWSFLVFAGLVTLAAGFREILPRVNQAELRRVMGEQHPVPAAPAASGALPAVSGNSVSEP
jgi:hypothetical protein